MLGPRNSDPASASPTPRDPDYPTSGESRHTGAGGVQQRQLEQPQQATSAQRPSRRASTRRDARVEEDDADGDQERIGPYLIHEEIGRGSFATVFRGVRYVSHQACRLSLTGPASKGASH